MRRGVATFEQQLVQHHTPADAQHEGQHDREDNGERMHREGFNQITPYQQEINRDQGQTNDVGI